MKSFANSVILPILFLTIMLCVECSQNHGNSSSTKKNSKSELKVEKRYHNGRLVSVFHYRNGVAEGMAENFYSNGKLASVFYYTNGKLNGKEVKYYPDGELYRIRHFVHGKLQDTVKKYYRSGRLMSIQVYLDDMPSTDLKEYSPGGKLITDYPKLIFQLKSSAAYQTRKLLEFHLSNGSSAVQFFIGPLLNGKYLYSGSRQLAQRGNTGQIPLEWNNREREIHIVAKYLTLNRNFYLIQATYHYR